MKKSGLGSKLIFLFCSTSILPILVLSFFSYYSSVKTIRENTQELNNTSVKQIDDNLNLLLEAYEDLLYQIYTEDDMVEWVDKLNAKEDESMTVNQMRRYIRGILNSKDYIRSITIITEDGAVFTYDQLTAQSYQNSWMQQYSLGQRQLYEETIGDYQTHIFSTEYATTFANQEYYLFHMAHRIIDYKDLEKQSGIVVLSLDVSLLQQVCQGSLENNNETGVNFIIDKNGKLISYDDASKIGTRVVNMEDSEKEQQIAYVEFVGENHEYKEQYVMLSIYKDDKLGWNIVGATDKSNQMQMIKQQMWVFLLLSLGLFGIAILVMVGISGQLVHSVQSIVRTMKKTQNGNMSSRVEVRQEMPAEMEAIAVAFNDMLEKLNQALLKEKEAIALQQEAQIKALEAQINPHFLYNTLDTINWMAIDQDAFAISNAINSLAKILRYAISDSNQEVTVAEEIDWLKKYIYLQQLRLKEEFICDIQIEADVQECKIHKLLLQPFVENAMLHGFRDRKEKHLLTVMIKKEEKHLFVIIKDNGIGISNPILQKIKENKWTDMEERHHIGMQNAFIRLKMYYGNEADVSIDSIEGEETTVSVKIPYRIWQRKQS